MEFHAFTAEMSLVLIFSSGFSGAYSAQPNIFYFLILNVEEKRSEPWGGLDEDSPTT